MPVNPTSVILKGHIRRSLPIVIGSVILALGLSAIGIFLLFTEKGARIALYPLLSGLIPGTLFFIFYFRASRILVTEDALEIRKRLGKDEVYNLTVDIGDVEIKDIFQPDVIATELVLYTPKDKELISIPQITPKGFYQTFWVYFHLRKYLPAEFFISFSPGKRRSRNRKTGLKEVRERIIRSGDRILLKDTGFAIPWDGMWYYFPESENFRFPGEHEIIYSPEILTRKLDTAFPPGSDILSLRKWVIHLIESDLEPESILEVLDLLAGTFRGSVFLLEGKPRGNHSFTISEQITVEIQF